jgi:4,4'-diaponeurosporenoate glycosyltransferase
MLMLLTISAVGLVAGFLLLRRVPTIPAFRDGINTSHLPIIVIIPARNEAMNLPALLKSLPKPRLGTLEVLVVDDGSTDATAAIAAQYGATVITSLPLPTGWTGKNWACHQGALAAGNSVLLFLDADTRFVGEGFAALRHHFATLPASTAVSMLPFHRTQHWYEELSLFFNIVMAMGAGGFGGVDAPHLFGPSLLLRRELYRRAGGHEAVRQHILENLEFASSLAAAGGEIRTFAGRGALETRMFPLGLTQLCESWKKAFASGARTTSPLVLGLSIAWLSAAMLAFLTLFLVPHFLLPIAISIYLLFVCQIAWFAKQLGTYRWLTAVAYPVALAFYFAIFAQSLWMQLAGRRVRWRGREI